MALSAHAAIATSMAGLVAVGSASAPHSLADLGGATALAAIGVVARHAMDTAAERKANKAAHMPKTEWATLDYQGLGLDCLGAPFLGPGLLALARWVGHVPDYAFAAVIIGAGAYGPQLRTLLWSVITSFVAKKTGG